MEGMALLFQSLQPTEAKRESFHLLGSCDRSPLVFLETPDNPQQEQRHLVSMMALG